MQNNEKETQEISLRLEKFEDIFSVFDIRPYSKRALSVDFLDEIKRASLEREEGVELVLNMPEKERNEHHELMIKERLKAHFKRHYFLLQEKKKKIIKRGILMMVFGVMCMLGATFVMFEDPSSNILLSFLIVFLEPAAWFLLWEGMDQIIFVPRDVDSELSFYRKMSDSKGAVHFMSY